jgi:hypothetical protein
MVGTEIRSRNNFANDPAKLLQVEGSSIILTTASRGKQA